MVSSRRNEKTNVEGVGILYRRVGGWRRIVGLALSSNSQVRDKVVRFEARTLALMPSLMPEALKFHVICAHILLGDFNFILHVDYSCSIGSTCFWFIKVIKVNVKL